MMKFSKSITCNKSKCSAAHSQLGNPLKYISFVKILNSTLTFGELSHDFMIHLGMGMKGKYPAGFVQALNFAGEARS
jgi:hypothetical protein